MLYSVLYKGEWNGFALNITNFLSQLTLRALKSANRYTSFIEFSMRYRICRILSHHRHALSIENQWFLSIHSFRRFSPPKSTSILSLFFNCTRKTKRWKSWEVLVPSIFFTSSHHNRSWLFVHERRKLWSHGEKKKNIQCITEALSHWTVKFLEGLSLPSPPLPPLKGLGHEIKFKYFDKKGIYF